MVGLVVPGYHIPNQLCSGFPNAAIDFLLAILMLNLSV